MSFKYLIAIIIVLGISNSILSNKKPKTRRIQAVVSNNSNTDNNTTSKGKVTVKVSKKPNDDETSQVNTNTSSNSDKTETQPNSDHVNHINLKLSDINEGWKKVLFGILFLLSGLPLCFMG